MLATLLKGIGGLVRDTVELSETLVVGVIDYGKRIDDVISNAPKLLEEGYHEGLFTDGDKPKDPKVDETTIVKRPAPTDPIE